MNTTAPRPTENTAIGRAMKTKPPRLSIGLILLDLSIARTSLDRYGEHLLGGKLNRALGIRGAAG